MNELKNGGESNYLTRFSCESLDNKGRSVKMGEYICFSAGGGGFLHYRGKQKFNIEIYRGIEKTASRKNHLCLFSLDEVKEHVNDLFLVVNPDELQILDIRETKEKYYIDIIINSSFNIVYRFILTWIRFLWERPYSLALKESFFLKQEFTELDPFSRYTIARTSFCKGFCWGTGHSAVQRLDRYYKPEEIKSRLHSRICTSLNDLYERSSFEFQPLIEKIDEYSPYSDLEYFQDPDLFKKRLEIYIQNKKYYDEKIN